MANPLNAEQITQIAISQKIKNIIVFDDNPEAPPYSMHCDISDTLHEHAIMIIYGFARVMHFFASIDARIGRHESIIAPEDPSESDKFSVTGYVFGELIPRITCGYQIPHPESGKTSEFLHREMLPAEHESRFVVIADDHPIQQINLYFEITAILKSDTEKIKYDNIPPRHMVHKRKIDEWYPDKRPVHKLTVFDNPFGPYTNYLITL